MSAGQRRDDEMEQEDYKRMGQELTRAAFAARYPHPFLAVLARFNDGDDQDFEFETNLVRRVPSGTGPLQLPSVEVHGIFPLVKSARNPYADRISVGRAANCDVVVPSNHLSKLHAHFLPAADGTWELRDANSANGTFKNGERIAQGIKLKVKSGDRVRFGVLEAQFVDAGGLYDLLQRR
jgi:hypothetical protein